MEKFLVIQTGFIGDAILASAMLESLHAIRPDAHLDILVRKGNETLFTDHPFLHEVLVWDKKTNRNRNLWELLNQIRSTRYNAIFNAHRFASSGILTLFSKAINRVGFKKNPLSSGFTHSLDHEFEGSHEIERNHRLIAAAFPESEVLRPQLYPSTGDYEAIRKHQTSAYRCMAPTSVWFTKQWPTAKWIELCNRLPSEESIYLLGAPSDSVSCNEIRTKSNHPKVVNLAGKLTLLQSAALMEGAAQNYVNDSAPMHLASSVNAPTTAIFCSTIPQFGFGPLSDQSKTVETSDSLDCRPCGIHGHNKCPKGHFDCTKIDIASVI